ncbi:MAG: FAD-dependent oxidoreductase, partial [Burkholderiaceae bacterium]
MRHLIIGAGPAGVIAAEQIRKLSPHDEITIVGDEPERPYSRMAIPYLLISNIDEQGTLLRKGSDHFDQLCIRVVRQRVRQVQPAQHQIVLEDGTTHGYDRLLIATGSTPIRPPISGMEGANVHTCWTLADARQIIELAKPGAK